MACWSGAWGSLGEDTGLDGFRDTGESCLHCVCTIRTLFVRTLFVGNQYILASIIRHLIKAVLLSATLAIVALPGLARAQSGSAGGSIGNDEKSLSGSRETPRAAEPSKPARRSKTETEAPSRAPRNSGGGDIDGAWILTSVGTPCGSSTDAVVISSGRMVGQYGTSQVSPNGGVSGIGSAGSLSWTMSGRFSGRSGSGTFRRSDGCAGSWTGAKQ
jgi:hypothetical protein